jgi:transcriptional regulator with XRE-family HTH domain
MTEAVATLTLGKLLQSRREAAGLSRPRLARLVDMSPGTIEGWETERVTRPPIAEILRIARALGISLGDVEAAVLAGDDREPVSASTGASNAALELLKLAMARYDWSEAQVDEMLDEPTGSCASWLNGLPMPQRSAVAATIAVTAQLLAQQP